MGDDAVVVVTGMVVVVVVGFVVVAVVFVGPSVVDHP